MPKEGKEKENETPPVPAWKQGDADRRTAAGKAKRLIWETLDARAARRIEAQKKREDELKDKKKKHADDSPEAILGLESGE